ncbi:beta-ketoacyl synthase N-terminal-like domain-containing protein [Streptomyces sp. CSDS2]|uniref:beta-ketoacyl synthase N-terminal-like domain-containing protein n=1 Tax=Streptomyces sp. CSDS2 TaxID=3055051 RepID=UPI0025B277D2|nr:beta-ketoacyl synthase N-terminal-like domain-containing protein [Streptomyces sp. CSDS2]MDN3265711.1 beta-ketoacyl synthase N-terminal-like domain-containing protein [Streptomyces sp. CSDS2]
MSAGAVVTGIGVIAPNGTHTHAFWAATKSGENALGPAGRPAGRIHDLDAAAPLPGRLAPQTDRATRLALAAAEQALADAGAPLDTVPPDRRGVVTAVGAGGTGFGERQLRALWSTGPAHVSAYTSFAWFYAADSGRISVGHDLRGPVGALSSGQAGGLDALGRARQLIRRGNALVLAGGADASLTPLGRAARHTTGLVSGEHRPDRAYLPFDRAARGYLPGEGGALLVVEDETAARARGARIHGRIAGHAATLDPRPGTGRAPGLVRAVELALADARCHPAEVDVVFADAAGSRHLDRVEADALAAVFGPGGVPVTAPKTAIGRLGAGGAPVDVAAALLCMAEGLVPPTTNTTPAPEYRLDLVTGAPRAAAVRTALVIARGHGGFNSALVLRSAD